MSSVVAVNMHVRSSEASFFDYGNLLEKRKKYRHAAAFGIFLFLVIVTRSVGAADDSTQNCDLHFE
jgi:hypothetical protein